MPVDWPPDSQQLEAEEDSVATRLKIEGVNESWAQWLWEQGADYYCPWV